MLSDTLDTISKFKNTLIPEISTLYKKESQLSSHLNYISSNHNFSLLQQFPFFYFNSLCGVFSILHKSNHHTEVIHLIKLEFSTFSSTFLPLLSFLPLPSFLPFGSQRVGLLKADELDS